LKLAHRRTHGGNDNGLVHSETRIIEQKIIALL